MTVIVSAFVPRSGFMVAADGLRLDAKTKQTVCENAQKIYSGVHPMCDLILGWCGSTALETPVCGNFNFAEQSLSFLRDKRDTEFESWDRFVWAMATTIYGSLLFCAGPRIYTQDIPEDPVIAGVLLAGYFRGEPVEAAICFTHNTGNLCLPIVKQLRALKGERQSDFGLLSGERDFFYESVKDGPESLIQSVETAQTYIQESARLWPKKYGGRTHVAFLTQKGFEWRIPPLQS